jgi:hypothetical protein
MAHVLSQLLDAQEPLFSMEIQDLERISGHASIDVQLIADIAQRVRMKLNELGLDPEDTTDKELYHALQGLIKLHDEYLTKAIGCKPHADLDTQFQAIKKTLDTLKIPKSCWVLKQSVAKKILKANPPKKVMKYLKYKSIDSMIKRESIIEIYAACRFLETKSWQEKFIGTYKKLMPSDFELRDVKVLVLKKDRWSAASEPYVKASNSNMTHLKELGSVVILPMDIEHLRGAVISILSLAIYYIGEIRSYSAFFKLHQVRPDFGAVIVKTILKDPATKAKLGSKELHWRIIQRHFGNTEHIQASLFEPHVQVEDLLWRKAEEVLYTIEPALKFWEHLDYVGSFHTETPVSFNMMDNAVSYCNGLSFKSRSTTHLRQSLVNEMYLRYLDQPSIEAVILEQLNDDLFEADNFMEEN